MTTKSSNEDLKAESKKSNAKSLKSLYAKTRHLQNLIIKKEDRKAKLVNDFPK